MYETASERLFSAPCPHMHCMCVSVTCRRAHIAPTSLWVSARGPAALQHVCGSGPLRRTTPAVRLAGREIRVSISALPPAKQTSRSLSLSGSGRSSTAGLWRGGRTSAATYKETACAVHHLRVAVGSVLVCFGAEMMQEKREKTTITRIPFCTRF